MATLMERLAFLQKVPILMKATADDETPCPGYLFEEIGKISHDSVGWCQCLLEYLLDRLQGDSCHVKLKVLKILLHLCGHGSHHFLTELRRNATFIQEVTVYSGPPDPIHGTTLYQKVRAAAQDLACQLFTDTVLPQPALSPVSTAPPALGMGSESVIRSGMQGFGYSPRKHTSGGGTLLDRIQKAAEVVASAVLPPTEQQGIRLHDNHYRAVMAPSAAVEVAVPACSYNLPSHGLKAEQRSPGQVGGGWEETDSGHSSHDSSQENGNASRASGTDSQSGASRESGDLSERVEAMHLGDCCQETMLISSLTDGPKVFLSREEAQRFIKECSILNCEVVVELLCRKLQDPTHTAQMRALSAIACLMSSDLLSLDHIFGVTHKHLGHLSKGPPGPAANKATKLLRQFEALMGTQVGVARVGVAGAGPLPLDSASKLPDGGVSLAAASRGGPALGSAPGEAPNPKPARQVDPPSVSEAGWGPVTTESSTVETPILYHGEEEGGGQAESSSDWHTHTDTRPSLFSGMQLLRPKPVCASATPTLPDGAAPPTLPDRAATPTLTDRAAPPTLTDRAATPTLPDRAATPTLTDGAATPTLPDRAATPTLPDRAATPTLPDRAAPPTLPDRAATPTLTDRVAPPTLVDRAVAMESDSNTDPPRETRPPHDPPPSAPPEQRSAFSFLNV
ncbi:AP-4 complex accessory subunit Tepsin [Anguilla rostrata]|uniref:AP-4 complex accessory subunit Tepsin n=1 Tax=Anguilla rostrata TaxID=7938 RepID=UPI0030D1D109